MDKRRKDFAEFDSSNRPKRRVKPSDFPILGETNVNLLKDWDRENLSQVASSSAANIRSTASVVA